MIRYWFLWCILMLNGNVYSQLDSIFTVNTGNWQFGNCYQSSLAQQIGAKLAGQDGGVFNWKGIQASYTSTYNWNKPDSVVACLQSRGLDVIPTLICISPGPAGFASHCDSLYQYNISNGLPIKSWYPDSMPLWLNFVDAVMERYDNDGLMDMPGLVKPVNKWRIETEWQLYWCSPYPNNNLPTAQQFVQYINATYTAIKTGHPDFTVALTGIDSRHDKAVFYDGYTAPASSLCMRLNNCSTQVNITPAMMSDSSSQFYFVPNKRNLMYILHHANYDALDIHQYGLWNTIPAVMNWIRDSVTLKPVWFLEGGGPFCSLCETYTTQADLYQKNASYVVYYFITGIQQEVSLLSWHLSPEYKSFSDEFGDLDLLDSAYSGLAFQYLKRPSFYTYQFLANHVFSSTQADSVIKINESSSTIYHYQIIPLGLDVVWSTQPAEDFTINGSGNLNTWNIPTLMGDSTVDHTMMPVVGSSIIHLQSGVPVFYSWNNIIGIESNTGSPGDIKLYPNPFEQTFCINLMQGQSTIYVDIYNSIGKIIYHQIFENTTMAPVDLSAMPAGIYFCNIRDGNQTAIKKIVKQ